ncbi:hypothetical protein LB566_26480 [Mesorhizobium sp. CA13]|uniref:hypothetical protein n=1 Tax=Mesorhizobium sp. CA13 TaxID=2876643 RepID=UPI001CCDFBE8|nr:hypothetical protein [Mesorhizobium sp. CA13]MBZ9857344.1 hypothetical protein [Mesorhizobium sp. CA13]
MLKIGTPIGPRSPAKWRGFSLTKGRDDRKAFHHVHCQRFREGALANDFASRLGMLEPEEISQLQQIFEYACSLLGHDPHSLEAEHIALKIASYQAGTLEKDAFLDSLKARTAAINSAQLTVIPRPDS